MSAGYSIGFFEMVIIGGVGALAIAGVVGLVLMLTMGNKRRDA